MTLSRYFPFTDNIVARAEFRHQLHIIHTSRSGRLWITLALVMLIPALIGSLLFFASGLITPFITVNLLPPEVSLGLAYGTFLLLIVMNVALYVVVQLITVGLAANSIQREKEGRTWESLLLTNVDARQIVWGKWWATLRALWDDHVMVALLRLGLIAWAVMRFAPDLALQPIHILALALVITICTLLDGALSAALGVFAPLPDWSGTVTGVAVLSARTGLVLAGLQWAVWMFAVLAVQRDFSYLLIGFAGLLAYVLVIWGVLGAAQIVAVRGQVSPPGR